MRATERQRGSGNTRPAWPGNAMNVPWPIAPMKAVTARVVPVGDGWMYEPKWDGHRVLVRRVGDDFDAVSSTGKPKLPQWPWLATAVAAATDHDVVLDGEVIAYDERRAAHVPERRSRRPRSMPSSCSTFSPSTAHDLRDRPWSERRALLESSVRPTSPLTITPVSDDAEVMEAATRSQRFEGIVAKRASSTYQSGRRAPAWVKVKYTNSQEMVIGGYKLGEGNRTGLVRLPARRRPRRRRRPAVRQRRRHRVQRADADGRDGRSCAGWRPTSARSPCHRSCRAARYRWVRPELVAQVGFLEWTEGGGLRAPVFLGLRDDKPPADVVRES